MADFPGRLERPAGLREGHRFDFGITSTKLYNLYRASLINFRHAGPGILIFFPVNFNSPVFAFRRNTITSLVF